MRRISAVAAILAVSALAVRASDDSKPTGPKSNTRNSLAAVQALAQGQRTVAAEPQPRRTGGALAAVKALADESAGDEREPAGRVVPPAAAPPAERAARENPRGRARRGRQAPVAAVAEEFVIREERGFFLPQFGFFPQFGPFGGGGFFDSTPVVFGGGSGFRRFSSVGVISNGFFDGFFFPAPVFLTIGPPVTVRFDAAESFDRHQRLMIEASQRLAEQPAGLARGPASTTSGDTLINNTAPQPVGAGINNTAPQPTGAGINNTAPQPAPASGSTSNGSSAAVATSTPAPATGSQTEARPPSRLKPVKPSSRPAAGSAPPSGSAAGTPAQSSGTQSRPQYTRPVTPRSGGSAIPAQQPAQVRPATAPASTSAPAITPATRSQSASKYAR